ncbi:MAG TPA: sialate O-acetylesterase, partial [Chryseolinea sp.]|nr:sialate O-acetylesterase [Chryseolinea sp.]
VISILLFILVSSIVRAQLRMPAIYGDHMVIQKSATVPIWGWATASQQVTIKVSWDTTTIRTKAENTTFWKAALQSPPAGGPHTITIKAGEETKVIADVLSGEVWLCSGQSNMEWSMAATGDGKEIMGNVNDATIRLFDIPNSSSDQLQTRGEGSWKVCNAENVKGFSAVGYFFGKKINQDLNVPVGLINASWGGTPAEVWLPREKVEADASLKAAAEKQTDDRPWCPSKPGVVFNSMLNPIIPFRLAGALWYQGESNTGAPFTYKKLMETLILDWREKFLSDLPFYYVQIAPYTYGSVEIGTLVREQEVKMLEIPKTGMVVISDQVDNVKDIHPQFKKPVGERLANIALVETYGKTGIVYKNPLYQSMKVEKNKIRIQFQNVPSGLVTPGGELTEFQIAGEDHKFYPATAKIDGGTVVVSAKDVKAPVAVRFGWKNESIPNLFSKEGLPVSSFRTDDWPIVVD